MIVNKAEPGNASSPRNALKPILCQCHHRPQTTIIFRTFYSCNPAKASTSQFQDLIAKKEVSPPPKATWPRTTLSTPIHYWIGVMAPFWSNWLFTFFHRHRRGTVDLPRRDTYSRKYLPNYSAKPWQPATIWAPGNGETGKHGICLSKVP